MSPADINPSDIPYAITLRLLAGQSFNAYASADREGWSVAIGPISHYLEIARCRSAAAAQVLVNALRIAHNQPPEAEL